jgi:hypothetical protein
MIADSVPSLTIPESGMTWEVDAVILEEADSAAAAVVELVWTFKNESVLVATMVVTRPTTTVLKSVVLLVL